MTKDQFRTIKQQLDWTNLRFAQELGMSESSIERYATGKAAIRKYVALAIQYLHDQHINTKPCPHCGGALSSLSSMNHRLCTGCGAEIPWTLNKDQKPLVGSNRQDRRSV